jgi:hypothetical protein
MVAVCVFSDVSMRGGPTDRNGQIAAPQKKARLMARLGRFD